MTVEIRPSPNYSKRIRSALIRWIVLHADASPSESGTIDWILNRKSEVSYHLYIRRSGAVVRFVPDNYSAWACGKPGKSAWRGVNGINSWTLNVAFANRNDGKEFLTPAQIAAAKQVIANWRKQHPRIEEVITHAASATPAGRKSDPTKAPNFRLSDYA